MVCKYSMISQENCKYWFTFCVIFSCWFGKYHCLYEDQVGKFDWKQSFIGKVKYASFDAAPGGKRLFVATEENVVAALNIKSGNILWRQVLEEGKQGHIRFLTMDADVVTVSGDDVYYIRGWDPSGGFLQWEWTLPVGDSENSGWHVVRDVLYHVHFMPETHAIEIAAYDMFTGSHISSHSHPASWLTPGGRCVVAEYNIICIVASHCHWFNWENNTQTHYSDVTVSGLLPSSSIRADTELTAVRGTSSTVRVGNHLLSFVSNKISVLPLSPSTKGLFIITLADRLVLLQATPANKDLEISARYVDTGDVEKEITGSVSLGPAEIIAASCLSRKGNELSCRLLLSSSDYTTTFLLLPGKLIWTREEALAYVVAVEMLDLPVSDTDFAIEQEFQHKETGFIGMFFHRINSQILQLRSFFLTLFGVKEAESERQRSGLVRDEFGLHKIIIAVTSNGKVFGIDNLDGRILWSRWLPGFKPYINEVTQKVHVPFFVQRTARHSQHSAQCVLICKYKGYDGDVLFVFNPHNGQSSVGENGIVKLGYQVKQSMLLPQNDNHYLRGLLLMDSNEKLHVFPESSQHVAISAAQNTYIFTASPEDGKLVGYTLAFSKSELVASRTWEIQLGGKVIAVAGKSFLEKVHSQGRVLGDRSVLYKYINPNLFVILTQVADPVHKYILNVYLVDVVSGSIIFSLSHKRAKDPVHIVHSENWVLYSYFSDKFRRTEIVALELYEGKTQSNTTAFSSVASAIQPIVDRQAYILPAMVRSMRETITEKGITSKHILMGLSNGAVLELPWMFVDPRRPVTVTQEMREEGVIPYLPELPIPPESIINYNQSLQRARGIYTSPSGLESTCLVFVYGLDLFYTRISPSKTYDLLKEDFEYPLIAAVLVGLILAAYITKKLSSKKALKQAWR